MLSNSPIGASFLEYPLFDPRFVAGPGINYRQGRATLEGLDACSLKGTQQKDSILRSLLIFVTILWASVAGAQDRSGNDTAGEWVATHYEIFGQWDSICDMRGIDADLEKRCYLRYVDVLSSKPKFGAVFAFITPKIKGHRIEFGFEDGTQYEMDGFQIRLDEDVLWELSNDCLRNSPCVLDDDETRRFIEVAHETGDQGSLLVQRFIDRFGRKQVLKWQLEPFANAFKDFELETERRSLRATL